VPVRAGPASQAVSEADQIVRSTGRARHLRWCRRWIRYRETSPGRACVRRPGRPARAPVRPCGGTARHRAPSGSLSREVLRVALRSVRAHPGQPDGTSTIMPTRRSGGRPAGPAASTRICRASSSSRSVETVSPPRSTISPYTMGWMRIGTQDGPGRAVTFRSGPLHGLPAAGTMEGRVGSAEVREGAPPQGRRPPSRCCDDIYPTTYKGTAVGVPDRPSGEGPFLATAVEHPHVRAG
jgi:hypothetical protein